MTPSDDLSPPRRPIFFPVVIATVFLTIIGLTAGFVLGERHNNAAGQGDDSPVTTSTTALQTAGVAPSGTRCPSESARTAAKIGLTVDLRQIMKIRTKNGTIVWICTGGAGDYYYQSQTDSADGQLIEGRNGLFLTKVRQLDTDHYEAVDHEGNVFDVTTDRFQIDFADGTKQVDRVVSVE